MRLILGLPTPSGTLADFLGDSPHALTRSEVLEHWSRHHLDACIRAGTVTRILPGVYCATAHRSDPVVMGEALNLWAPTGLVSGAHALHLYSPKLPAPTVADLVLDSQLHPCAPPWVRLRRTGPVRVQHNLRGVRTVEMPRALLDAWSAAPATGRRDVLYSAIWEHACTWKQVRLAASRAPRVSGRRDLERVLGWFAEGATSPLEVRAKHEVFTGVAFRAFEWQVELPLGTRKAFADMLHREAMVVVELDGDRYHSTREARDSDRERQTDLAAAGFVTVRFGWNDIALRPQWCRERLLTVLGSRTRPPMTRP